MNKKKRKDVKTFNARDCAYIALFVALMLVSQLALSSLPGVEVVTVLLVSFSFVFGIRRGAFAATAFSLLRQVVFGVFPVVLILYMVYFNALACLFGWMGKRKTLNQKTLFLVTFTACCCTLGFTLLDNILTPVWYGYTSKATLAYFYASISFVIPHLVCTAVSVVLLFLPLASTLFHLKRRG